MDAAFQRALEEVRGAAAAPGATTEGVLSRAAAALQRLPRYTGVYLYVLDGAELVLRAHAGRDTEHVRIPIGQGLCGLSARTKSVVVVDDVASDPRYLACNVETRSEIVQPILRGDRYLAQIDVDSDLAASFGEPDRAFLAEVARVLEAAFP